MTQIVGGASTMSRQSARRPIDNPYSVRAHGCTAILADDKKIIDWVLGLHGAIFGYDPDYMRAALGNFSKHMATSFPPEVEKEAAKLIGKIRPDIASVRFGKNGTDVTAAAVRLARAVTGRDKIASYGYHGFASEFAEHKNIGGVTTFLQFEQDRGVPKSVIELCTQFEWNDPKGLREAAKDAACVIIEVPSTDDGEETKTFMEMCRDVARENGALFILDEIVTGFRLALGGAAEYYRVPADLYCYGKAISNGYACSALGGRAELMEEFQKGVFFSGTFFDDPLGLTATYATLLQLIARESEVYPHLWEIGGLLKDGINGLANEYKIDVKCVGQAPRTVLRWRDEELRKRFTRECLAKGILLDRPQFSTMAHDGAVVSGTLDVVGEVFGEMAKSAH